MNSYSNVVSNIEAPTIEPLSSLGWNPLGWRRDTKFGAAHYINNTYVTPLYDSSTDIYSVYNKEGTIYYDDNGTDVKNATKSAKSASPKHYDDWQKDYETGLYDDMDYSYSIEIYNKK
mgnify:CR=1 FL=1